MYRTIKLSSLVLAVALSANAASFQLALSTGLAYSATVNSISGSCVGATQNNTSPAYTGCVASSATPSSTAGTGGSGWESSASAPTAQYGSNMFSSASTSASGSGTAGSFFPSSSYTVHDDASSTGSVNLSLPSSGSTASTLWMGSGGINGSAYTTSLTIPVGIYGANIVWTMLNDAYGTNNNSYTQVTFNFGSSASQTTTSSVTYALKDGEGIRDAVDCTGTVLTGVTTTCGTYAQSTTATYTAPVVKNGISSYTVDGLYSATYNGDNKAGAYLNTTGTVNLDAQRFDFLGAHTSDWLVSITVSNVGGQYFGGTSLANTSRTGLSAVTVETDLTPSPEPSTVAMIGGGLGLLAWARRRRAA